MLSIKFYYLQMENVLTNSFRGIFGSFPEVFSSAPGRINLIGEHTDYNSGYVLPAAIDRHVSFLASRRKDSTVRVWAENFKQEGRFELGEDLDTKQGGWIDYVKGVYWVLAQKGASLRGVNAYVWGNVPLGSGLSSSAALEVSALHALNMLFKLHLTPLEEAKLAQESENDYVGVKCGLMDQFISVFGKKDRAVLLDCESLEYEYIPLCLKGEGLGILVYDTGVRRDLAGSDYNKRRAEAAEALQKMADPTIRSFRDITQKKLLEKKDILGETHFKRARHVVTENTRVKKAVGALRSDDFLELGTLMFQSHESLRDDYQVSCPELDLLYDCGKRSQFCFGARLTGAGFGGSGIALVQARGLASFKKMISDGAREKGFKQPTFYEVETGEGARAYRTQLD